MLRTVELAEATLAVREWGEPDGRPLLFLHSLGPAASAAFLGLAAAPLVARGLRLVAPDQPGFGRSPALPAGRYACRRWPSSRGSSPTCWSSSNRSSPGTPGAE